MSAEEAKKQSAHDVFSGDCQFFFAVGVSNAEVIGEFADFSQAFRLREGGIILFSETGSSVSVQLEVWLVVSVVGPFSGLMRKAILQTSEDRASVRHCSTASHGRHKFDLPDKNATNSFHRPSRDVGSMERASPIDPPKTSDNVEVPIFT